jgi:DNA-binding transcriptional MocR family regulator
LPSEPELASRYNVSRDTVRRAMAVLRELELIQTRRGMGHYVAHAPERVYVNAEPGAVVSARLATREEQEKPYGAGRYGWPVLVVEEPGQPPRIYDGTRTVVSFGAPRKTRTGHAR